MPKRFSASMLREHGAQRPSVFEILTHVHRLRGTKSRFAYTIPSPQPLSPRQPTMNPLDSLVSFRAPSGASPSRNAGIQARDKVLEAIAPMRRGRPTSASHTPEPKSRPPSPQKEKTPIQSWLDDGFTAEENKALKSIKSSQGGPPIRGHRSGVASIDAWKVRNPVPPSMDEAWSLEGKREGKSKDAAKDKPRSTPVGGFDNDFAEKLWHSFEASSKDTGLTPGPTPGRLPVVANDNSSKLAVPRKSQDAFEGLGLSPSDRPPPQTLGEARKLRTGLAVVNGNTKSTISPSPSMQVSRPSSSLSPRATPSPRPSQYTSGSMPTPAPTSSSWKPSPIMPSSSYSAQPRDASAESRFPSVEELDATFSSPSLGSTAPRVHSTSQPQLASGDFTDISSPPLRPRMNSNNLRPVGQPSYSKEGVRSEQVTGVAMRESKTTKAGGVQKPSPEEVVDAGDTTRLRRSSRPVRPSLSRKHRSSIAIKQTHHSGHDVFGSPVQTSPVVVRGPHVSGPKDWLTGDNDGTAVAPVKPQSTPAETPVLREFTSKHSSIIQSNSSELQSSQEVVTSEQLPSPPSSSPIKPKHTMPKAPRPVPSAETPGAQKDVTGRLIDNGGLARGNGMQQIDKVSSSSDEGPEDVNGFTPPKSPKRKESKKRKGRQSSVHDLVDLWGGGVVHLKEKDKQKEKEVARSPAIGDYKSHDLDEHAKLPARRSTFLPSSPSNPRSASPQPMPSSPTKPARSNRPHRSPSHHRKQSSHVAKPNTSHPQSQSGRTRPSSMFVFPVTNSKSDSSATLPSPAVSPPEELIQKRTRRTSISDMVQRYEAIGSSKGSGPVSPLTVQKPTPLKVATPTTAATNIRTPKLSHGSSPIVSRSNARAGFALPILDNEPVGASIHARTRTSPTGLARASTLGHRDSIWTREVENPNFARPRRSSPEKSSVISSANELSISDQQNLQSSFLPATPPPAEDSPQRSPSPEKPYQGVGKLIDQWQRKTGDIEPVLNSSPRRGGFAAKRALPGLVGGGVGRGR